MSQRMLADRPRESDYLRYSAIHLRSRLAWPGDARVALWVVPNIEHYEFRPSVRNAFVNAWPRMPAPDVMEYSYRDYGNRVGFWRMLESLDRFGIRVTASVSVAVLEQFPEIREAMVKRRWEMMSHGEFNTRYLFGASVEEEREFYRNTSRIIQETTGQTLKGMLAPAFSATPHTPALMKEAGLIYTADWFVDDQPFPLFTPAGPLVGVPYSRTLNDGFVFRIGPVLEPEDYVQACKDQFDVLYEEGAESGRVMCLPLHPFLIGQPHRIKYLEQVLEYILRHDAVWCATGAEIAEWYAETAMPRHIAELPAMQATA